MTKTINKPNDETGIIGLNDAFNDSGIFTSAFSVDDDDLDDDDDIDDDDDLDDVDDLDIDEVDDTAPDPSIDDADLDDDLDLDDDDEDDDDDDI